MKVVELFSGIGAQRMALTELGVPLEKVYVSEIEPKAIRMYNAIHGETENLGDISKVEELPECDLVTWSYPCTSVSIAGKQEGMVEGSGTASSLGWETIRLVKDAVAKERAPRYLLMENVPAILFKKNRPEFDRMCKALEDCGYTNTYAVLDAQDYGLPQKRRRCFMVSEYKGESFIFPDPVPLTRCVRDIMEPEADVPEGCYLSPERIAHFEEHRVRQEENGRNFGWKPVDPSGVMNAVTTNPDRHASGNFLILAGNIRDWNYDKAGRVYSPDGCSPTVETPSGGGKMPKFVVKKEPLKVRYITEREAWRLMGFPDDAIDRAFAVEPTKTGRLKAAGNSIAVNVLEAIFAEMYAEERKRPQQRSLEDYE